MDLLLPHHVLLLLCSLNAVVWACPYGCTCVETKVYCKGLSDFPSVLPSLTTEVYLLECSFSSLKPDDLTDFSNALSSFLIKDTVLREVHPGTFDSSLNMGSLKISGTELMDLPVALFQNLQKLQYLHLILNKLSEVRPQWFSPLTDLRGLDLSKNLFTYLKEIQEKLPLITCALTGEFSSPAVQTSPCWS